jgi:hypothetical protein
MVSCLGDLKAQCPLVIAPYGPEVRTISFLLQLKVSTKVPIHDTA